MTHGDAATAPTTVLFLLVPGFPLLAYASAVEPLRAANVLAGTELYAWRHLGVGDQAPAASNGVVFRSDFDPAAEPPPDVALVCAGGNPAALPHRGLATLLRRFARRGVRLGGISAGAFLLARAGLLEGVRCTIHWEHAAAFAEAFPTLELSRSLFEIDGDRLTCAGGIAALDMMHAMIRGQHGAALAGAVSDWFLQTQVRGPSDPQRLSIRARYGVGNPRLGRVLSHMENALERPASRRELANLAGVSVRQLERLFAAELQTTIEAQYRRIRLEHGRTLLTQTALPVLEVASLCGFTAASHFSRAYRAIFGRSPREERAAGRIQ